MNAVVARSALATAWVEHATPNSAAACRLFCFSFAGGSAGMYRQWHGGALHAVEVCPVQLPGRESRMHEAAFRNMRSLAKVLASELPVAEKPFAFFGHSVGALLCFEVARELRRRGGPLPFHLFASGSCAPQLCPNRPPRFHLKREQLVQELRKLGGTPEAVLDSDELLDLVLPAIRADFSLLDTYAYAEEEALALPLTALTGSADAEVETWEALQWNTQTKDRFVHAQFRGDHFFLQADPGAVCSVVADGIANSLCDREA